MQNEPTQNAGAPDEAEEPALEPRFLEMLICPLTHGPLRFDRKAMELVSAKARLAYPIRSGVPILLESEARELKDGET